MTTILYPEAMYPDDAEERRIFGPGVTILRRDTKALADLTDADCAAVDGLMLFRQFCTGADLARFPRLRAIVRMGVGYDRIDRAAAAARGVTVCNVPDYGTTEVADHAMALVLALRRGIVLHHEWQRRSPPEPWRGADHPLLRRSGTQGFGILGMGRIGTAVALRAKAFGFRVTISRPASAQWGRACGGRRACGHLARADAGVGRAVHPHPADAGHRGPGGRRGAGAACRPAPSWSTPPAARCWTWRRWRTRCGTDGSPAPGWTCCRWSRRWSRCRSCCAPTVRGSLGWKGRLIITPHSAYLTPEASWDIRIKSAETMRAALLTNHPQNVIPPGQF